MQKGWRVVAASHPSHALPIAARHGSLHLNISIRVT